MSRFSLLRFLRSQYTTLPPVEHVDLSGKTVMVIGANTGLGFEASKHFARMNPAHLVLACRSKSKGEAAILDIKKATGFIAELILADLSDFASISAFVTSFQQTYNRLDVLVCNAGIVTEFYETTKDGWESSIQVNHLSPSMIALLLLPIMVKTAQEFGTQPHITFTSSELHNTMAGDVKPEAQAAPAILEKMSDKDYCTPKAMGARYPETKLLNVQFVRGLTARLPSTTSIVVNSVNPGFCYSEIGRNTKGAGLRIFMNVMHMLLARSTEMGSRTLVWAALAGLDSSDANLRDHMRGAYTEDCKIVEPSSFLFSQAGKAVEPRIWNETISILSKADPRVQNIAAEYLA